MRKQFTLGKDERLKSRKQIGQLFDTGETFVVTSFRVYFILNSQLRTNNERSLLRFGIGVSSKNFKKAVDRNRIKRLTREVWRLQKNELEEKLKASVKHLNVFFIYTGKELPDFTMVKDKVSVALKKLVDKIDESVSQNS
ncbi:MAG TPA: ribonuclease P protein component [Chitinophagaceae bacterium]|nr:ribonuclease P protein component [Chitinophagaceae bacterium]